jgi:hypothetical protein
VAEPPPRWTYAVGGSRLRVSAGLLAWVVLATAALALGPVRLPGLGTPALLVACLVASMLVHEGAHAGTARRLGYRVEWVVLGGLSGLTAYLARDDRPLDRAAVALAGPAASAALALALLALRFTLPADAVVADAVGLAVLVNVLGLVVNLVPLRGSDGARAISGLRQHARARRSPEWGGDRANF